MAIDIESPGADRAALKAALQALVGFGPIDLNGASMVHVPQSAHLLSAGALSGVVDGGKGTTAFLMNDCGWTAQTAATNLDVFGSQSLLSGGTSGGLGLSLVYNTTVPSVGLGCFNEDFSLGAQVTFAMPSWQHSRNNHVILSWDLTGSVPLIGCVCNRVPAFRKFTADLATSFSAINYDSSGDPSMPGFYGCGCPESGGGADFGEIFVDLTHSIVNAKGGIDEADIDKFFKDGQVQSLGTDGSTPFGVQPAIYLTGNAASFVTNRGSGGAFTLTGTITDA